jgi:hypothetical protein
VRAFECNPVGYCSIRILLFEGKDRHSLRPAAGKTATLGEAVVVGPASLRFFPAASQSAVMLTSPWADGSSRRNDATKASSVLWDCWQKKI